MVEASKGKAPTRVLQPSKTSPPTAADPWRVLAPIILFLATLACYWVPMTSAHTSILWDAADLFRVRQDYLSRELHAGRIPFWTPYPWAGYPFLADPEVGAWYPLNWPFFLIGVSPHVLVVEHWLHALLASFGAYFLALRLVGYRPGAVLAGLCYGLSGYFVGHSSHTVMIQGAAWTPWLLLLLDRGLASHAVRHTVLGGLAAGAMILVGHFQTALYSFLALGLFATARVIEQPRRWARILGCALAVPFIGTLISAIATGPGLELAMHSVRTTLAAVTHQEGIIPFPALATLFYPNFYGLFSENYQGPQDITQFYFYAGILLVPFAICGWWRNRAMRWTGLLLVVPTIWYAMGQPAGLYLLVARLPGFSSVRAPVHVWFVPTLGLALGAAAGLAEAAARWPVKWLPRIVLAVTCVDLFYFQSATNPLAYARISYEDLYGAREQLFGQYVGSHLPPLTRFEAPDMLTAFGPLQHYLDLRAEVSYGYPPPLKLTRYTDYIEAMAGNPALRNGLNVSLWLDMEAGAIRGNPNALPRANFPKSLVAVQSMEESRQRLPTLDQARQALVPAAFAVPAQDGSGAAEVREFAPGHYRIHYRSASRSVLRVGSAYFDGWSAKASGERLDVFPVDHALTGVLVPPGEADVDLDYHSNYFWAGVLVTLSSLLACLGLLWFRRPRDAEQSATRI